MTQRDLCAAAKISAPFLSEIENGKRGITAKRLFLIADALGVSISWFCRPLKDSCGPEPSSKRNAHHLAEIGECEGGCVDHGGHRGDVLVTEVRGSDGKNWGLFSYCETARLIDKQRGMSVKTETG